MTSGKYGTKWSEEETILAFYYYCKIPFGKLSKTNPEIIRLASILGRTPSSVSLKMWNLLHFNPESSTRSMVGMGNAGKTAFDKGLITVLPDYTVRVSSKLKDYIHPNSISWLLQCDKQEIVKAEKFIPKQEFLQYHNDVIFIS